MTKHLHFSQICLFCSIVFWGLMSCSKDSNNSFASTDSSGSGQGGSMARFTISGNQLYTVSHSTMRLFDLTDPSQPVLQNKDQNLGFDIETIFTMDTLLFVGSQSGMYIFNITRPEFPQQIAHVSHITACDPVVASGNYAYVTLNSSNTWCGRNANELQVYNISDPYQPQLKVTEVGFSNPKGLGVDGNKLFVCDNTVKVYDVSNAEKPKWIDDLNHIAEAKSITAYDLIPANGILIVSAQEGVFQFDYTGERLKFLSKIAIQ